MHESKKNTWSAEYKINSLLVNPQGYLGLYGALNLLQETAWIHAESLGFGFHDMEGAGLYWVLTRQTLHMKSWPRLGSILQVRTWLCPPEGAFLTREFSLHDENHKVIGTCATSWLALDRQSRKILPIQNVRPWEQLSSPRITGITPEKIPVTGAYERLARYRVRNSDLDINQHVNNTKYAQWILDAVPYEFHHKLVLKTYSVNFLAETHLGDKVEIDRSCLSTEVETSPQGTTTYRGVRMSDEKVLFTALLEWEKKS